jgi:hypothetical protein
MAQIINLCYISHLASNKVQTAPAGSSITQNFPELLIYFGLIKILFIEDLDFYFSIHHFIVVR